MSYVVTCATGKVGTSLVDYLRKHSVPIHVIIRSEEKAESFRSRNIQVTVAELTNADALTKAFRGAKSVFAMNPTANDAPDLQVVAANVADTFASAIKAAKVERVVVLSSIGSERSSKTGNIRTTYTLEQALKETAPQVVMVRCASFTENWLDAVSAVKAGYSPVLCSMYQRLDRKVPHIATSDIGRVVGEYMIKPTNEVDNLVIIELEGPEPYSPNDIAKIVSEALGISVPAAAMTDEMIRDLLGKFGWPKTTADNFIEMRQGFDNDIICWTNDEKAIRIKGVVTANEVLEKVLN
ncbi:hypothetical protein I4U23_012294 [Adineta vaga]|nr:hypothetical protein I4U23_012294 [Adineta vaga]